MTETRPPQRAPARPGDPPSLVGLVARGVMDAELAALVWMLVEARVPLVVAAPPGRAGAGGQLLAGIVASIHADEAVDGLLAPLTAAGASSLVRGRRAGGVVEAESLEDVRSKLGSGPLPLSDDQLTFLGCVLVRRSPRGSGGVAATSRPTCITAATTSPASRRAASPSSARFGASSPATGCAGARRTSRTEISLAGGGMLAGNPWHPAGTWRRHVSLFPWFLFAHVLRAA